MTHSPELLLRVQARLVDMTDAMSMAAEPIDYLAGPLAARGFVTVLVGRPGESKSFLTLALAHAVSTGQEWVGGFKGLRCREGVALIVDAENGPRLMGRRFTLMGMDPDGVQVADAGGLHLPEHSDEFEMLLQIVAPDLVVLDSLRRLAPNVKENDSDAMAPILGELVRIARETNTAIIVIHHRSTKTHASDVRGSSAIEDQADLVFVLERLRGDPDKQRRRLRCIKDRIDVEPKPIWLRLGKTAGFVVVEGAEAWDGADKGRDPEEQVPAHEVLADRLRALADQVAVEDGWPPARLAAAIASDQKSGTFQRAIRSLVESQEWDSLGSTRARRYRPFVSSHDSRPIRGGSNGANQDEHLFGEEGA